MTLKPQTANSKQHPQRSTPAAGRSEPEKSPAWFRAGQRVAPGLYRQIEGSRRMIRLTREDYLPASLDGRVAWYERVRAWSEVAQCHGIYRAGA